MKHIILFLFIFSSVGVWAQCPTGDITLSTQQEIDDFATNYPGCTEIPNTILIGANFSNTNITSLAGLSQLTSIGGGIRIVRTNLTNLTGLENLTSVNGYLSINANGLLTSLTGIENLTSIGGNLFIRGVSDPVTFDSLISISALENITSIGGGLTISGTTVLTNLVGLENLTNIGGGVSIERNDALADLTVFENITSIDGELVINDNDALTSLMGLENIDHNTITNLEITWNNNLSVCGLTNICMYLEDGGVTAINNNTLGCNAQLEVEQTCVSIPLGDCPQGDIWLETQAEIDDFVDNFSTCDTIFGNFTIFGDLGNEPPFDLSSLSFITTIMGNLSIAGIQIDDLTGLESIAYIDGNLRFDFIQVSDMSAFDHEMYIGGDILVNNSFFDCAIQAFCDHAAMGGVLSEYHSDSYVPSACMIAVQNNCSGPEGCPAGDITIASQANADQFITANPDCTEINGSLTFAASSSVVDVTTGFANIEHINGDLWIRSVEVEGIFANLDTITGNIYVDDNTANYGSNALLTASFPNLKYIGGDMRAAEFEGGAYINASFPALERVEGSLDFCGYNGAGINCIDCVSLEYIGGDITAPVGGLNYVDTIMGSIDVRQDCYGGYPAGYPLSLNTAGFNELKYVGGNLILRLLESVDTITGFQQLNTVVGTFRCIDLFNNNPVDMEITGFGELRHAGSIEIIDYDLTNLDFLNQLESVENDLKLILNQQLTDMSGLNHPVAIGGELEIEDNPQLSECAVQAVCNHINIGGSTTISNNMAGCNSVGEVQALCPDGECLPNGITFSSQAEIDNFAMDYPGCVAIQGSVVIEEAVPGDITNLDGLAHIGIINGSLIIQNNTALSDIYGLSNLNHTSITDLQILNNNNLSQCAITGICNYLIIGGTVTIGNNAVGCNTAAEIMDTCGPGACPPGNVMLGTQQDIEAYFLAYPGCIEINGHLNITSSGIDDLSSLSNIESVSGNLFISGIDVDNLEGLNNLKTVGGDFTIRACDNLSDISALSNLHTIGGSIEVWRNHALPDLHGLHNISNFNGECEINNNDALVSFSNFGISTATNFIIEGNDALTDLNGLGQPDTLFALIIMNNDNLMTLEGLQLEAVLNSIQIDENQSLTNLQGLDSLGSVGGSIFILQNNSLLNFNGLQGLQTIGKNLNIERNNTLVNLEGLNNLESIGDGLKIFSNLNLINLQGLNSLESIGENFEITSNSALVNLEGLDVLDTIGWGFEITSNSSLTNFAGANALSTVGWDLVIQANPSLANFAGFNNLESVGQDLNIVSNSALVNFEGLNALNTVGWDLNIISNLTLTNFEGADSLNTVGRDLFIEENLSLINLEGFNNLKSVGSGLSITSNSALVNLQGLNALNTVGFGFDIISNPLLVSLEGLDVLNSVGWDLTIQENQVLSQCATQGVCDYLENGGSTTISNNLLGCNNVQEVETGCDALPVEMTAPLRVYLNNKTAILEWRTATEVNNAGFEVQRSKDGIDWEKIGWQTGQGNTSIPHSYMYTDRSPLFGTSYYRLKQVDFNGDTEYSNIVSLQYIRNGVTVYPNPVKEQLYLHTDYSFVQKITMYNSIGSQVIEITNPGNNIDVSTLPKGIYILKITIDDEDFHEKILVE